MRWIIGDIHGMLNPLNALLGEIPRVDPQAVFYFVGDYVNRGPESRGVIERLLALTNAKFIRGNHDDVLDQILHGVCYADNASRGDRHMAFQWFLDHGLYETVTSYGVTREMIAKVIGRKTGALDAVVECFPATHRQFIRSLPIYLEDNDLFVIHGKWPLNDKYTPAELLDGKVKPARRTEILWGRYTDAELKQPQAWPKRGFFGHTPVPTYAGHETDFTPIISGKMALIDTAAALSVSGRLTAVCAETGRMIQADVKGNLIPQS